MKYRSKNCKKISEAYLGLCQIAMTEFFSEVVNGGKTLTTFARKTPSQVFGRDLHTPLEMYFSKNPVKAPP